MKFRARRGRKVQANPLFHCGPPIPEETKLQTFPTIDPLTLAVVRGSLEQLAEEMDLTLKRTAFSPVISEGNDMANGLYHRDTGEVIV